MTCRNRRSTTGRMVSSFVTAASNLQAYCNDLPAAPRRLRACSRPWTARKNRWLCSKLPTPWKNIPTAILEANASRCRRAQTLELIAAQVDRLRLTPARICAAATGLREVAALPDPIGRVLDSSIRPNGLQVHKVGVPLGRHFFHLRVPAQRHRRRRRSLPQERQCHHSARRQGSPALKHRPARRYSKIACASRGSAGKCHPAREHHRSRRRRPTLADEPASSTWSFRAAAKV